MESWARQSPLRCTASALLPSITDRPAMKPPWGQHQEDSSQNQLCVIFPSSNSYFPKLFLTPSHSSAFQEEKEIYRVQEAQREPQRGRPAEAGCFWASGPLRDARDLVQLFKHQASLGPFFPQMGFQNAFQHFLPLPRFLEGRPTTGC